MSEEYRKFDAADYVKEEDARGFLERLRTRTRGRGCAACCSYARRSNSEYKDTGLNRGNLYEAV